MIKYFCDKCKKDITQEGKYRIKIDNMEKPEVKYGINVTFKFLVCIECRNNILEALGFEL